ncbi:MAG: phosphodiester glycosidase family protein [Flavobacteriaceae bacterium]
MNFNKKTPFLFILFIGAIVFFAFSQINSENGENILSYKVNLDNQVLKFYLKNEKGENFRNFKNLKNWLNSQSENLIFAMNGGMYKKDLSPQGLYIENGVLISRIDSLQKSYGNFYMQPNGIFYITNNNKPFICETQNFKNNNVKFANQSGPLLLINGIIHSNFRKESKNLNIRNGVGILPNGNLIFAMSKQKINFYDFATYFKTQGCKNALYLDGFVSKTYLPKENWVSMDGNFGVIIAETKMN